MSFHKMHLLVVAVVCGVSAFSAEAATITLSSDTNLTSSITISEDTTLDGGGFGMTRSGSQCITVDGAALTVRNITISGGRNMIFFVTGGGSLTLASGTTITDISCSGGYSPISVWGGTLTLESGSAISGCVNSYVRSTGGPVVAGAITVSERLNGGTTIPALLYLNGGTVTGCRSSFAGGIAVSVASKVFVEGDANVTGNTLLDGSTPSNLLVQDQSGLELTSAFTGSVGYTAGYKADEASTNVFGSAYSGATSEEAARFVNDSNSATGIVEGTVLYWSVGSGQQYQTVYPAPIAFKSITRTETGWELVVTNVVEYCSYRLLGTADLASDFAGVTDWFMADFSGEWTTNVVSDADAYFWRAEGREGEKPVH